MVYSFSYAWDDLRNVLYLHQILSLMKPLRKGCLLTEYYGNISTSGMQECAECWARRAQDRRGVHTALVMTLKTQTQNTGIRQPDTGTLLGQMAQWWQIMANVSAAHERYLTTLSVTRGNMMSWYRSVSASFVHVWQWSSVRTASWSRWQELLLPLDTPTD